MKKSEPVPLTNAVYTRGVDANVGREEEGGVMEAKIMKWKESWVQEFLVLLRKCKYCDCLTSAEEPMGCYLLFFPQVVM